jgi:hypothetical protein
MGLGFSLGADRDGVSRPTDDGPGQADQETGPFADFRAQALRVVELGMPAPTDGSDVYAVLVDIPGEREDARGTVMAMGDGTSSMYSTGGSLIGAGRYQEVRAANDALRREVAARLGEFSGAAVDDYSPVGTVGIHAVLGGGRQSMDLSAASFWKPDGVLLPLLAAIHNFIAALRTAQSNAASNAAAAEAGQPAGAREGTVAGGAAARRHDDVDRAGVLVSRR